MQELRRHSLWLVATLILTILFGTIYTVGQQILRLGANDPQVQLAEDTAASLNSGLPPTSLAPGTVDFQKSLAPFVIIYDVNGHPIAGNGYLHGSLPSIPIGVLQAVGGKPYNFVSWQPEQGIRLAAVSVKANSYYVLSGRSLIEVEKRESLILQLSALGWFMSEALVLGSWTLSKSSSSKVFHAQSSKNPAR